MVVTIGTINTYRMPQLLHLCALQSARDGAFRDVTHVVHARTREELRLPRVIAWLGMGYGDAWDCPW